jgi:hypothetical protein
MVTKRFLLGFQTEQSLVWFGLVGLTALSDVRAGSELAVAGDFRNLDPFQIFFPPILEQISEGARDKLVPLTADIWRFLTGPGLSQYRS